MKFRVFSPFVTFQNFYGSEIVKIYSTDHCGAEMYEMYRKNDVIVL